MNVAVKIGDVTEYCPNCGKASKISHDPDPQDPRGT